VKVVWPPLVDQETFWACRRLLQQRASVDRARKVSRDGRAVHLLSYLTRCECGGAMARMLNSGHKNSRVPNYRCYDGCRRISVKQAPLDDYVENVIVTWLADPKVYADLARGDDSAAAAEARADAERLRADLAEWRQLAKGGKVTALTFAEVESDRLTRIADAERREQATTLPPVLAGIIGPDAADRWFRLDLGAKRQAIRAVADIRIRAIGKGQWQKTSMADRVQWRWLLGPDADQAQAV
jgi:hypothetical protein